MAITQVPPALLTSTTGTGTTVALSASPTFTGTVTTPGVTFSDSSIQTAAASPYVLKNRIINGAMVIDQRNAGASVTPTGGYTLDRWGLSVSQNSKFTVQQNQNSVTPPTGFTSYLGLTTATAVTVGASDYFALYQPIEGYNIADLDFGKSTAKTVTLSFWVRSSLTGTFGGTLANSGFTRSYPFSYTISVANTWEQKSVTIAGDTSGTWLTTNGIGMYVWFALGVGTTGSGTAGAWGTTAYYSVTGAVSVVGTASATFYVTGVQLEIGSSATPFERRLYGQELANCYRYYYRIKATTSYQMIGTGYAETSTTSLSFVKFPVTMRTNPTALESSGTNSNYFVTYQNQSTANTATPYFYQTMTTEGCGVYFTSAALLTAGNGIGHRIDVSGAYLGWSAEL